MGSDCWMGTGLSFSGDGKILELDCGDGFYSSVNVLNGTELNHLKTAKMVYFILCIFYHN